MSPSSDPSRTVSTGSVGRSAASQRASKLRLAAPPCINAEAAGRVSTCPRQTKLSANCRGVQRAHSPSGRTLRFRGLAREFTRSGMRTDGSSMSVCQDGGSPPRPPVETRLKASIRASGVTPADAEAEISSAFTSPTGWSCPYSLRTTSRQSAQEGTRWTRLSGGTFMSIFATDLSRSQMEPPRTQSRRRLRAADGSMVVPCSTPESDQPEARNAWLRHTACLLQRCVSGQSTCLTQVPTRPMVATTHQHNAE